SAHSSALRNSTCSSSGPHGRGSWSSKNIPNSISRTPPHRLLASLRCQSTATSREVESGGKSGGESGRGESGRSRHPLADALGPHVGPHLFDVGQAFLLGAVDADVGPAQ